MRGERIARLAVVVMLVSGSVGADAASLATVRERGVFAVCAHPDALPYSSQERTLPGFQLEIAEASYRFQREVETGGRVDPGQSPDLFLLVYMLERRQIETREAPVIAADLVAAFDQFCAKPTASTP